MAEKTTAGPHALLVGMPFQGCFTPAVNLAIKLATNGFTVTFFHVHCVHHRISEEPSRGDGGPDVFVDARPAGLDIRYELMQTGLPMSWADKSSMYPVMKFLFNKLPSHVEELLEKLLSGSRPVECLIADTFCAWPSTVAKKFGIPYVSFWTEPATVLAIYYHMDLLMANGHFASGENGKDTITYIPGVQSLEPTDLMSDLQATELTSTHHAFFKAFEGAKSAEFMIGNLVQELEDDTVAVLTQKQRFYGIGPIYSGDFKSMVKTSLFPESDCSKWLNSKPPGSVLYVSFGSLAHGKKRDMEEIAYGVLGSKASFVWVSRSDAVNSGESHAQLPEGFTEESQGKGIVVPWCSQREVLMHPSVGGFLTHCGWNSILESIWCGVPMVCYPLYFDQFTNRKLVVNDWRIGLDLGKTEEVTRGKVSNAIDGLMEGKDGARMKEEIKKVQKVVRSAIAADGSSQKNFERFIADLSKHLTEKTVKGD